LASTGIEENDFKISGFSTLGIVNAGNSTLGYRRDVSREAVFDDTTFKSDSLLALQLDIKPQSSLSSAIQLVARDRSDNSIEDSLEWAYAKCRLNRNWVARTGRLGLDIFMLSEYRNLGFSYLWARPPVELYAPMGIEHFDGVDLSYSKILDEGEIRLKAFSSLKDEQLFGVSLSFETAKARFRLGATSIDFGGEGSKVIALLKPALQSAGVLGWADASRYARELDIEGKHIRRYSAGVSYDHNRWRFQSELAYIESDYKPFSPLWNGYFNIGYRVDPVTFFILFGYAKNVGDIENASAAPPGFEALQGSLQSLLNRVRADQKTASFGLKWDVRYDTSVKLQADHTWVEQYGGVLWQQKQDLVNDTELDTISLNINFVF